MVEYAITKLSSKGQIVIPSELRKDLKVGEQLLIIRKDNSVILKRLNDMKYKFKEDLQFALKTEQALQKYENGEYKKKNAKEFLEELKEW